jgi:hypothetical protein
MLYLSLVLTKDLFFKHCAALDHFEVAQLDPEYNSFLPLVYKNCRVVLKRIWFHTTGSCQVVKTYG